LKFLDYGGDHFTVVSNIELDKKLVKELEARAGVYRVEGPVADHVLGKLLEAVRTHLTFDLF